MQLHEIQIDLVGNLIDFVGRGVYKYADPVDADDSTVIRFGREGKNLFGDFDRDGTQRALVKVETNRIGTRLNRQFRIGGARDSTYFDLKQRWVACYGSNPVGISAVIQSIPEEPIMIGFPV